MNTLAKCREKLLSEILDAIIEKFAGDHIGVEFLTDEELSEILTCISIANPSPRNKGEGTVSLPN